MARIFFIRHFETVWNQQGKLQGRRDIPISSPVGTATQSVLDQNLHQIAAIQISRAYCSPLLRTQQTAQLHGFDTPDIIDDLIELDFGPLEGMTKSDRDALHGVAWTDCPDTIALGESFADFVKRVRKVYEGLREMNDPVIVVFGHGAWMRCCMCLALGRPPEQMNKLHFDNGHMVEIPTAGMS